MSTRYQLNVPYKNVQMYCMQDGKTRTMQGVFEHDRKMGVRFVAYWGADKLVSHLGMRSGNYYVNTLKSADKDDEVSLWWKGRAAAEE